MIGAGGYSGCKIGAGGYSGCKIGAGGYSGCEIGAGGYSGCKIGTGGYSGCETLKKKQKNIQQKSGRFSSPLANLNKIFGKKK